MVNWVASLFFGLLALGLACLAGSQIGLGAGVWVPAGLVLWLTAGMLLSRPSQFGDDVADPIHPEQGQEKTPQTISASVDSQAPNEQSLHTAVIELTRQLRSKEVSLDKLQAKLTEREFRRSLSRVATIHETLVFTLHLLAQGKLAHADAVEQLRQEIESAISDLGLEHHVIQVGATISTLPLGSFIVLRSETATTPTLAGTVKEVVSSGLCARDEDGKPHFISPSKINAYKI